MTRPPALPPLLHGLFRELVAQGVPIGTRDYLDGLRALAAGYGSSSDGQGERQALARLAQTLWARSDEERRLIARWFAHIPATPADLLAAVDTALAHLDAARAAPPDTAATAAPSPPASTASTAAARSGDTPDSPATAAATDDDPAVPRARISFSSVQEGTGLPVPRLALDPALGEAYVLHPQALIPPRNLAVLWRRYRRGTRGGPRTELDIDATVAERCRRGLLLRPACRPRRSNAARLLILADTSPSMDPWRPFLASLAESLPFGRLARAETGYFSNLPRRQLYTRPDLRDPQPLGDVLRRFNGAGLLIVSDAGSARGYLNRRRANQTADLLDELLTHCPAIVWLNPMPRPRWAGTTAEHIAANARVPMLPLDATHLLRAIDILRGNK